MITERELAELIAATPDGEPLFSSIAEMCAAFGFDAATEARIRLDTLMTEPRTASDTLQ